MHPSIQAVLDRIRAFKRETKLSHAEMARRAGLAGHTTLLGMEDEGWNPRSDTLRKLEVIIPADFVPGQTADAAATATQSPSAQAAE